jgi:archaellum component FlaF (FlaF/FlaG flagellin family)
VEIIAGIILIALIICVIDLYMKQYAAIKAVDQNDQTLEKRIEYLETSMISHLERGHKSKKEIEFEPDSILRKI